MTSLLGVLLLLAGCSSGGKVGAEPVDSGYPQVTASSVPVITTPLPSASPDKVSGAPVRSTYAFPVRSKGVHYGRFHHDYPATDIFAPCGSPVVAPVTGQVQEVTRTDQWSSRTNTGATRGGLSVSILGADGVRYYGSHLRSITASIVPGLKVAAGDSLGRVGNTGDARGIACHLHFGISPPCSTADWWNRRGVLSPYRFLKSWQAGDDLSPVSTVRAWRADHGCPRSATVDR